MKLSIDKNKTIIIIVLLVITLSLNFFQSEIKGFFYNIFSPAQKWLWQSGSDASNLFNDVLRIKEIQKEKNDAWNINKELLTEIIDLQKVKEENSILKEALDMGLNKDFNLAIAEVIAKEIGQDYIFINKGSQDGLSKNMPVITQQKILLGKISEVYSNRSKVMLISSKDSSFDAELFETNISGLLQGQDGGRISIGLLPKNEKISQGDLVVSSSLKGIFPSGLLVGKIENINNNDINPFQEAEVSAFFSFNDLNQVLIILNF